MTVVEAEDVEDSTERQADYEAWLARKAKSEQRQPAKRIDTDELVPEIALKGQRWTLDDKSAATLEAGRCFRISLVLRAEGVWQYSDGTRWKTTLLEVEGLAD